MYRMFFSKAEGMGEKGKAYQSHVVERTSVPSDTVTIMFAKIFK